MKLGKIFLLALLVPSVSVACLNSGMDGGTTIDGGSERLPRHIAAHLAAARRQTAAQRLDKIDRRSTRGGEDGFEKEEFRGVEDVLNGRYQEALEIFQRIEKEHPGNYNTAANLGTTYELLGDIEQASKWIAEGIRRNPDSHRGTEWLHLAILDAKAKLKEDPGYLTHAHIVPIPEHATRNSTVEVLGKSYLADEVLGALQYQLYERLFFVRAPDPVVADLLFSFGQLEAGTHTLEEAIKLLGMARDYGYPDGTQLDKTVGEYQSVIQFRKFKRGAWIGAGILASVLLLVYAYKKKWFFLSSRDYKKHLEMKKLQEGIFPSGAA
jgi:tetratricopeptide (TPR) repeat protein